MRARSEGNSGVYQIRCLTSGYVYRGGALNLSARMQHHKRKLRNGESHNPVLQFAWNLFGESNFVFEILKRCDPSRVAVEEQRSLDGCRAPMFNILRDARRPPKFSESVRQKLSEKAKAQHRSGKLGRQTWRS